jgi:hypothetical protein
MARPAGTRRFVAPTATVTIGPELERAVAQFVRDVAGDVVDTVEAIVAETAGVTREKWYTMVKRRSGRSGDGTEYTVRLKGDSIQGVVYNDARASAKRRVNVDLQGRLRPGETKPSEQRVAAEELYAYFVHRPNALSMRYRAVPMAEYRELMSYFRRTGRLPIGYAANSLVDKKGRKRPVGIAKLERNPLASDGAKVWDLLVTKGHKRIVKVRALDLDKALTASAKKLARR